MTRVAAIDCGTNSIRLLVADVTDQLQQLDRRMQIIRLGEGVDETGSFSAAALSRAFDACREYQGIIEDLGAERVRFVATSASRDADNSAEFTDGVARILGVTPEIVSGAEEAQLSFDGATRGLDLEPPVLVFDIGGGSTEFIRGAASPEASISVDMGCVRFAERFAHHDPMTAVEREEIESAVSRMLDDVVPVVPFEGVNSLIGLAGTVTTMTGIALGLAEYDSEKIHRAVTSAAAIRRTTEDLVAMTSGQRRDMGIMHPGRADVIAAGALILEGIMARSGANEVAASEHDILDGIAWSLAATE